MESKKRLYPSYHTGDETIRCRGTGPEALIGPPDEDYHQVHLSPANTWLPRSLVDKKGKTTQKKPRATAGGGGVDAGGALPPHSPSSSP